MSETGESPDLGAIFDEHVRLEFEEHDVQATMQTMTGEPYVWNVATAHCGLGHAGVRRPGSRPPLQCRAHAAGRCERPPIRREKLCRSAARPRCRTRR